MTTATNEPATAVAPARDRSQMMGWRRLQIIAAVVAIVTFLVPMIATRKVEGFLLAMAAPFVIGLVLARFLPRVGAIFLGVVSFAILAASAPFLMDSLRHPEAAVDFVPLALLVVSTIVATVVTVPAHREIRAGTAGSRAARGVALATAGLALALTGVAVVAAAGVESAAAQPGDVTLRTRDFAFAPARITAAAGTVSVHVTNDDATRHTFTINGVTDVSIAPNTTQRVTFEADPGTYSFFCTPHTPGMDGTLVVE